MIERPRRSALERIRNMVAREFANGRTPALMSAGEELHTELLHDLKDKPDYFHHDGKVFRGPFIWGVEIV
jgi:hypothetical protein